MTIEQVMALTVAERQAYNACSVAVLAETLNERTPADFGFAGERLVAASASGATLVMTVEIFAGDRSPDAMPRRIDRWRDRTCGRAMIEAGGTYRFVWIDSNGSLLGETTIDRC